MWDLLCVQQASYLEGGPLMWMLSLYLHVNQKSNYDDIYDCHTGDNFCDFLFAFLHTIPIWDLPMGSKLFPLQF